MARVAILGTGRMGGAMARRLTETGHDVILWDRTQEKARSMGVGTVARTPAEAVRDADLTISIVTNANAVRTIYTGDDGTPGAVSAASGRVLVNSSTSGPWVLPELEEAVRSAGGTLLDGPILGSPEAVETGKATVLLGGDRDAIGRAQGVLESFGPVRVTGPIGSASQLKLIANSMFAAVVAAGSELLDAGEAIGLDRDVLFTTLAQYAPSLAARTPQLLDRRVDPPLFTVRDLLKDLDMALRQAHDANAALPLTGLVRELYGEVGRTGADLDIAAIRQVYGRR